MYSTNDVSNSFKLLTDTGAGTFGYKRRKCSYSRDDKPKTPLTQSTNHHKIIICNLDFEFGELLGNVTTTIEQACKFQSNVVNSEAILSAKVTDNVGFNLIYKNKYKK